MSGLKRQLRVLDDDDGPWMRVAFATSDRHTVDQHFGSACSFAVYGVDVNRYRLLNVAEFGALDNDTDDKLAERLQLLENCIAVYCRACGASAVRQLLERGIQPVKVTEGALISDLLGSLQQELRDGPSSWLAKAIRRNGLHQHLRFEPIESEGWIE
ncbi:MAG: NifB/NifX family molybdenum-iron cluster-binding protein [Pseudomonadota bacterium]|nr:nitrogen fixation protein NifX [Pseudomonadales bacterium]MDY6921289.1 NifB/NifX family molybdenum-iron cluster-binding protein [Pseudomonadota bacterium]